MKKNYFLIVVLTIVELALVGFGIFSLIGENPNMVLGIVLIAGAAVLLIFLIADYNKVVRYRNKIKESFALIDIQLKLRFDLIPNLVNTVKGYAKHEKEVITEITKLRKLATETEDQKEKLEYANKLVPHMKNLIAVAESYPELKASALYKSLMEQLVEIEDRIVAARRIYDSNVNIYNTAIEVFPNNLTAKIFGFKREEMFKIDAGENIKPTVD